MTSMPVIQTEITNNPQRIQIKAQCRNSFITVEFDHKKNIEENHRIAAEMLISQMSWHAHIITDQGWLKDKMIFTLKMMY